MFNTAHKAFAAAVGAVWVLAAALTPPSAQALPGDHNRLPEICQGVAGAGYAANEVLSYVTPVPFDLAPSAGAYAGNWALRLCPPQVVAPPEKKLEPDAENATSSDPELASPFLNDPNCYATVLQSTTKAKYDNFLGIPFVMREWGDLGTPEVYHFNTSADIRILGARPADNPSTPGDESLADEFRTTLDVQGRKAVRIPVGANNLTYRADTLVSVLDFPFIYIPKLPSGSKAYKELLENSGKFKRTVIRGYQAFAGAVEVIDNPVGGLYLDEAIGLSYRHGQLGVIDDVYNQDSQSVWVYDRIPPVLTTRTDVSTEPPNVQAVLQYDAARDVFYLEAIHPGGVRRTTGVNFLERMLDYHDHCNRQVRLSNNGGGVADFWATGSAVSLQWTARDPGPVDASGGFNSATLVHNVEIRDSYPPVLIAPPSQVIEIPGGQTQTTVELGSPRVFDLADLTPDVEHDAAGDTFALGLSEVTWTASDGFNSSQAVQLINIKEEGTNRPPRADAGNESALSEQEIEIVLTGVDEDYYPSVGRHDPLTFSIVEPPDNGFFVAPLLPFFIDDYRLEASALKFDDDLKNRDPRLYCDTRPDSEPNVWQIAYPYFPDWMSVDDAGNTMVYDQGSARCDANDDLNVFTRLVTFDANQELTASLEISAGGTPSDIFWDSRTDQIYVSRIDNQDDDWVYVYGPDLTQLIRYNLGSGFSAPWMLERPVAVAVDSNDVLYVATNNRINAYRQTSGVFEVEGSDVFLGEAWNNGIEFGGAAIESIATDSNDNLYVGYGDRIAKVTPARVDGTGLLVPGEFEGWLGYCSANNTNEYACDTPNRRSVGFACTNALCARDAVYGNQPGQFQGAKGIAVDPNDVLYVSDFGNARVQRFTPDGLFAGEAKSEGVGYGFLLGDFGNPEDISVNSDHFYVLNRDARLLHIFETTPITPIDDGSASVVYRSNTNYVGADSFRFGVTDGLDSAEATVTIDVTRNFRPPEVPTEGLEFTAPLAFEDQSVEFDLPATDPDGDFDTLSILIVRAPEHGEVSFDGVAATYVPDANYAGPDSFSYRAFDGFESSDEVGEVEIEVDPVEDTPTIDVEPERNISVGFGLAHRVDVFDPDADETLFVTIDWGDGIVTTEGHFERNGDPIPASEAQNPDGTLADDVEATGPILSVDPLGRGILLADHVYTRAGIYNVTSCVLDKLTENSGLKTPTSASKQACAVTSVDVTSTAELAIEVERPDAEQPPGATVEFVVSLSNLEFELDTSDPRFAQLPAAGTAIVGLTVSGELTPHLILDDVASADGVCSLDDATNLSCNFLNIPYGGSATITVRALVTATAPGGAEPGIAFDVDGLGMRAPGQGGGSVEIAKTGQAPALASITPATGAPEGYTEVTLTGVNFEKGSRVLFDGQFGTHVRVIDSTTLVVFTPAQPEGVVDVRIVNLDDQESLLADAWTYQAAGGGSGGGGSGGGGSGGGGSGGGGGGGALDPLLLLLLGGWALVSVARRGRRAA